MTEPEDYELPPVEPPDREPYHAETTPPSDPPDESLAYAAAPGAKLKRQWISSPNYSSRYGQKVRLIVIHSTEGAQTQQALGNFFANPASQVSSHVGIDNAAAWSVGEYVKPGNSAWTAGNANPCSIQAELCTPSGASANWSRATWLSKNNMINKTAAWVAEEAKRYGIPIVALSSSQAQGGARGVCMHLNLGAWGGGHVDCGSGFPMNEVIKRAKAGGGAAPAAGVAYDERDNDMVLLFAGGDKDAPVVVPGYFNDGKGRIRLGCRTNAKVRCDWVGTDQATASVDLGYSAGAQGFPIPKGGMMAILHLDEGTGPVAMCFTHP